jgi:hypothetical protein
MSHVIQLPTSQTPLTDDTGTPKTHNLRTLFADAVTASGETVSPAAAYQQEVYAVCTNGGTGDAYLACAADIPAQQVTITITAQDDGTWIVAFTAPDGTAISSEFEANTNTEAEIAQGLRAALTADCAGTGCTISGATDAIIITTDDPLLLFGTVTVTDPGVGTHTNVDTGSETVVKTNEAIPAGTTADDPYVFGPYHASKIPYLRCLADASVLITWKMGVP